MRPNIKQFVRLLSEEYELPSPIIDIGALRTEGQEDTADLRPFFAGRDYTGWDMRRGPGVNAIASVHHLPIATGAAGTVLLLDTLEHVLDPLASMAEVCRVLRPGGVVIASSHMNFPIHAHPSDYWRFTPMSFDYMMRPLGARFVFIQGNAENPHNVMGAGMNAPRDDATADEFDAAIRRVESRWPEDSYGGPLVRHEPLTADAGQRTSDRALPALTGGRRIEQSFVCGADGLCRIDVKMANDVGLSLRHLVFRLFEESLPRVELGAYRVLATHADDDAWMAVPFPVQPTSAGKRYALTLESPDAIDGLSISAKASGATVYGAGALSIDGEQIEGSLCFQAYCRAPAVAAGDVQVGEETLLRSAPAAFAADTLADEDLGARLTALSEQHWEQVRYLAATVTASLDAIREQVRANHAELIDMQRRTLDASTEKLLARSVRDNPVARALRRLRGPRDS